MHIAPTPRSIAFVSTGHSVAGSSAEHSSAISSCGHLYCGGKRQSFRQPLEEERQRYEKDSLLQRGRREQESKGRARAE
eukprot:2662657-Rhodomonas_salina.1